MVGNQNQRHLDACRCAEQDFLDHPGAGVGVDPYLHPLFAAPDAASGRFYVDGLQPLRTLSNLHRDLLTFFQRFESGRLYGAMMHEHILTAFLLDETEPLAVVEPLDRTANR